MVEDTEESIRGEEKRRFRGDPESRHATRAFKENCDGYRRCVAEEIQQ